MIVYVVKRNGRFAYIDESGSSVTAAKGRHKVLLTLESCQVISLTLPPLKNKDLIRIIRQQLPSHYPLPLDDMVWDYSGTKGNIRVYLVKKALKEKILSDWGHSAKIYMTGQSLPTDAREGVFRSRLPKGQDLYFLKDGSIDHVFYEESDVEAKQLARQFQNGSEVITDLSDNFQAPLFSEKKRSFPLWTLHLVPLIFLGGMFLFFNLGNRELRNVISEQEREIERLRTSVTGESDDYPWEEREAQLESALPEDNYRLMSELYPYFSGRARILNIAIQDEAVSIEAVGNDALLIMEALKSNNVLIDLSLHQIRREESGEVFSLSGSRP